MSPMIHQVEDMETGAITNHRDFAEALAAFRTTAAARAHALGLCPVEAVSDTDMMVFGRPVPGGELKPLLRLSFPPPVAAIQARPRAA